MKKIQCILLSFILLGCFSLQAKEYTVKDIPVVHLQDSTRYVSNPDSLISDSTVMALDNMLHVLKGKTGIEVAVIVVTGIEGGDCYDFAVRIGKEWGVGQKGLDNGLIVLLSTEERCVQIATGYGLEGVLPDAICKRIQNQYMVKHFGNDDWDTGLLEGVRALNGYLDGTMKEELQKEEETSVLGMMLILAPIIFFVYRIFKSDTPQCPHCKKKDVTVSATKVKKKTKDYEISEVTYLCNQCKGTFVKEKKFYFKKEDNSSSSTTDTHEKKTFDNNDSRGGSYGGGNFGGGGAGSKF
jgi:uncharacterized protein